MALGDYNILLGVVLDEASLQSIRTRINGEKLNPIKVMLDTSQVQAQINNIKTQLQSLSGISINLGVGIGGGGRQGVQPVQIVNQVNEVTRAYRELISLQNRIGSKQQAVAKLDTTKNQQEILELSRQVDDLYGRYQRLHSLFSGQFNSAQVDNLNRKFQITAEKLDVIKAKALDAKKSLNTMNAGGGKADSTNAVKIQAEQTARAYRELISLQNRIGSKQQTVARLDTTKNQQEILELSNQIDVLYSRYQRLHSLFAGQFSPTQVDALNRNFTITAERLDIVNKKIADVKANMASGIQGNFGNYNNQIIALENRFNALNNKVPQVRTQIDTLKQALATLEASDTTDALIANNTAYRDILSQVTNAVIQLELAEKGSFADETFTVKKEAALQRLNGLFSQGSQAARIYGREAENLRRELNACGNTKGVDIVNSKIGALGTKIKAAGVQTRTLGERLSAQFAQYSSYFSVYMLFMYAVQGLRDMFEQVKLIDTAMTELKKVTDETDATYDRFLTNAASKAKELGTTIDGLVSSTADFARLGYGFEDAQKLAEVANIYAVVGDEVENVEEATKSLISTMAAFKDQQSGMSNADFAMSVIDKFNEVGNNFAISSGGIGDALQRSASSLDAANNTIDESIALITAANTVVQNPEVVGTAFKTMSMRIRGAKTE